MPETNDEFDKVFGDGSNPEGDMPSPDEESWDFDPSEAVEFARLVPGWYHADITKLAEKKYSQNGNPMMIQYFFITDKEFYGLTPFRRFMLNGKGAGWTKEFLKAIALPDEAEGKKSIKPSVIVGRRCMVKMDWQRDKDGTVSDEWTEIVKTKPDPQGPFIGDSTLDTGV